MTRKRIGIWKRLIVSLGAVAVCAIVGETALRLWAPFPDYSAEVIRSFPDRYDPHLGYAGIPDLDQQFSLPDFKVRIRNNSKGFRDRERSYEKGRKRRIVILGDSYTWGWGVENEEIFPAIMEKRLQQWEVINLAQAGYSTDQELLLLEREGLKYSPDIVILVFCENDVKDAHSDVIDGTQPKPYFVEEGGALVLKNVPVPYDPRYWALKRRLSQTFAPEHGAADALQKFLRKSHLFNWLRFRLGQFSSRPKEEKPPSRDELRENIGLNLKLIGRMNELCRAGGATLVVVDIPSPYSPYLEEFCAGHEIPYLNLEGALSSRLRPTVFRRVGHWTPYGQRRVARALMTFLKDKRLVNE